MKNYKIMMLMALSLSFVVQTSWHRPFAVSADEGRIDQYLIVRANQMLLAAQTAEQVQAALAVGADVNAQDNYGRTALINAVLHGHENMIRMLLAAGADVHARNNDGQTALMCASFLSEYENVVRLLLDVGADVNAQDNYGHTVLMNSVFLSKEDLVRFLLDAGADVNAQDNDGEIVLMWAVDTGRENIFRMLLGWNDQMDALLARDDISDEAKLRLVALEPQAVQDTLDGIQTARQDQASLIHNRAMAVRPEVMQMLQDYLEAHPVSDYLLK